MAKVLITAQVQDTSVWEKNFRSHVALFRQAGVHDPMLYGIGANNEVAVVEEIDNVEQFTQLINSQENAEAMAKDGVLRETVRTYVLDKTLSLAETAPA